MRSRDIKEIFIENLAVMLHLEGKKSSDLAEFLKISKSTISMWFSKKSLPRMELLDDIADFLDITVSELLHDNRCYTIDGKPCADDIIFSKSNYTEDEILKILEFAEFVRSQRKTQQEEKIRIPIKQTKTEDPLQD